MVWKVGQNENYSAWSLERQKKGKDLSVVNPALRRLVFLRDYMNVAKMESEIMMIRDWSINTSGLNFPKASESYCEGLSEGKLCPRCTVKALINTSCDIVCGGGFWGAIRSKVQRPHGEITAFIRRGTSEPATSPSSTVWDTVRWWHPQAKGPASAGALTCGFPASRFHRTMKIKLCCLSHLVLQGFSFCFVLFILVTGACMDWGSYQAMNYKARWTPSMINEMRNTPKDTGIKLVQFTSKENTEEDKGKTCSP